MAPKINGKSALQFRGKNLAVTAPADKYIYIFNSSTDKFELRAIAESDITNLTTDLASKVTGISSATDGAVVLFDSTTGKLIKDSTFVLNNFVYGNTIYGGTLTTDLNALTQNGFYTAYGTATGAPSTSYSWFVTHINSSVGTVSAVQIATAFDGSDITYRRVKSSSTWGSWIGVPSLIQIAINTKLAGTGVGSANGKVYIGKADGTFSLSNLTAGTNVTITNADGSITINAASSAWTQLGTPTYLSSNTFTLAGDQTSTLYVGRALKYTISGVTYPGRVVSATYSSPNTTVTIRGWPLTSNLTAVSYGEDSRTGTVTFVIPNYYEQSATAATMLNDRVRLAGGFTWGLPPAYIIGINLQHITNDGSTAPNVNGVVNGNLLSTANTNAGPAMSSTSLISTGVDLNTTLANILISTGQKLEVKVTVNSTAAYQNATDLTVTFIWVDIS